MARNAMKRFREYDPIAIVASRPVFLSLSACLLLSVLFPFKDGRLPESGSFDQGTTFGIGGLGIEETALDAAKADGLFYSVYRVETGDMLSVIAENADVTVDTLVSCNDIRNSRALQVGQLLKIPSMSGIVYRPKQGDTLETLAATYEISIDRIVEANRLKTPDLDPARPLFLPDARLASFALKEINGELFRWPVSGWITSRYGWRTNPLNGERGFHGAIDIGSGYGNRIAAAMDGWVRESSYNASLGNYIVLSHHSGYSTLYAHMSSNLVKAGSRVTQGQAIGLVGNTGYSTGTHLHFAVFKNGRSLNPLNVLH